jgi:hypothetical protein
VVKLSLHANLVPNLKYKYLMCFLQIQLQLQQDFNMSTEQFNYMAEYYANWHDDRLRELQILPPYESKDRISQWVRGSIRHRYYDNYLRDLVVTGPKMKVCFSGCNWNRMVFAMNGAADENVYGFERWMRLLADRVKTAIWADPSKFKPGAISASRFAFDDDFIKPANDPAKYPDELRCKLSTRREGSSDGTTVIDIVDADLFTIDSNGHESPIKAEDILAGSHVIPVLRFNYYRNGERFGLNATILKALVYPAEKVNYTISNSTWMMDLDNIPN